MAAVSAQAGTDWRLSVRGLRLSSAGLDPDQTLPVLAESDPHFAHRQIGLVDREGRAAVHTGEACKQHRSHTLGDGFVVMGNNLTGPEVLEATATYVTGAGLLLEDRLIQTLESGRDTGGGNRGQLSAGLIVAAAGADRPRTDLRVDLASDGDGANDAVQDLRRLYDAYRPLIDYYDKCWPIHPDVGAQEWLAGQ